MGRRRFGLWLAAFGLSLALAAFDLAFGAAAARAQVPANGAEGPAAAALHRTFWLGRDWAMYGAPRDSRPSRAEFDNLAADIEATRFAASTVQVVVIVRGADAGGTIGLVEKQGRKFTRHFVESGGPSVFDIWRRVGCRLIPERILADFRENILAAEDIYRDLPIQFTGQVKRVSRDERGTAFVEFSLKRTDQTLACQPWPDAPQVVDPRTLRAGQRLEVAGQFAEYSQAGLKMHSCLFSPAK